MRYHFLGKTHCFYNGNIHLEKPKKWTKIVFGSIFSGIKLKNDMRGRNVTKETNKKHSSKLHTELKLWGIHFGYTILGVKIV